VVARKERPWLSVPERIVFGRALDGPTHRSFPTPCRVQLRTQRSAAKPQPNGARVCDPQELCSPPNLLTNPMRRWLSTCCGSQSRAPQSRRNPRQFRQILTEYNPALAYSAERIRLTFRFFPSYSPRGAGSASTNNQQPTTDNRQFNPLPNCLCALNLVSCGLRSKSG